MPPRRRREDDVDDEQRVAPARRVVEVTEQKGDVPDERKTGAESETVIHIGDGIPGEDELDTDYETDEEKQERESAEYWARHDEEGSDFDREEGSDFEAYEAKINSEWNSERRRHELNRLMGQDLNTDWETTYNDARARRDAEAAEILRAYERDPNVVDYALADSRAYTDVQRAARRAGFQGENYSDFRQNQEDLFYQRFNSRMHDMAQRMNPSDPDSVIAHLNNEPFVRDQSRTISALHDLEQRPFRRQLENEARDEFNAEHQGRVPQHIRQQQERERFALNFMYNVDRANNRHMRYEREEREARTQREIREYQENLENSMMERHAIGNLEREIIEFPEHFGLSNNIS